MPFARHYVGPPWPPDIRAYNYVLTLSQGDLAWEFLRRNPEYQRDYQLTRRGTLRPRLLKAGLRLIRLRRRALRALKWALDPFC